MDKSAVIEMLDSYLDALNSGDYSTVQFSDDVRFFGPMQDQPIEGKQALIEFLSGVTEGFRGVRTVRHIVDGAAACSLIEFKTNDGLVVPIVDYFEVSEGGITYIRPYFDPRPIAES